MQLYVFDGVQRLKLVLNHNRVAVEIVAVAQQQAAVGPFCRAQWRREEGDGIRRAGGVGD